MSFKAPVFTNKGKQLYASCLAGKNEIIFTNIKLGDGELMGQAIADLEDLVNPIKTIVLNDKKLIGNDQVLIRAVFKNIDIDTGFYWREVGLYAQDPENPQDRSKDILFCYQNAGDTAEYIPSASSGLIDKILSMSLVVSDVNSVNVSFFSESYALKEDLDEQIALQVQNLNAHKTDTNAHSDIFSQYVKKSGDTMSGALVMADSAQIFKNKDDHFLGLYGGSNFNNGAFFEICGKDHEEQSGNFNIYANNGTQSARLNGTPTGSLTWQGKNIVRSVNGVNADAEGNVSDIVESGPGYIRYANGVQICWGQIQKYTLLWTDHQSTWNLPKPFKDTNYTVQTTSKGVGEDFSLVEVEPTDKSYFHCSFIPFDTYNDGTIKVLWRDYPKPWVNLYLAIGYWK